MAIEKRIGKDGVARFRARVKDPVGRWYRSEWKTNRDEAMGQEAMLVAKRRVGDLVSAEEEGSRHTVSDFWAVYQVENRAGVSEGWKITQDQMARDYVMPVIGEMFLSEVGIPHVGSVLNRMKTMGRGDQLRKHVYMLMNQMFDAAVNYYGMIGTNPVSARYHGVKVVERESVFLRPEQTWRLLDAAQSEPTIWLMLLAGLRSEAACALTWENVHWETNQILICRAWKQKVRRIEDYPKGKRAEYVPMPRALRDYLRPRFEAGGEDLSAFVCPGPKGGMLAPETFLPRLKRLCRRLGLPELSPHKLRHSCTELYIEQGASEEDLRRLLNHKRGSTTLRYMHRSDNRLTTIAGQIERPALKVVPVGGEKVTHGVTHEGNSVRMPVESEDQQVINNNGFFEMVRSDGLEPSHLSAYAPQSGASRVRPLKKSAYLAK